MNKENKKLFIGIDVSKDSLDICYEGKLFKISNNSKSISAFIKAEIDLDSDNLCVFESTGGYERELAQVLAKARVRFHMAHPNRIHAFAKASGHFAKTDKLDALLLYKYAKFIVGEEEGDVLLSEEHQDVMDLRRLERVTEENLHAAQCRLKQMPKICRKLLESEIKFYKKQLEELNKRIQDKIDQDPDMRGKKEIITSFKGVGEKVASVIIAEMPEIGKISRRKVASLTGLAPQTQQSGKREYGGHIFGGRFYVRKALYMAALVASRFDEDVRDKYQKLVENGKPKKVALVAIMRKLVIAINAAVKNNNLCIINS